MEEVIRKMAEDLKVMDPSTEKDTDDEEIIKGVADLIKDQKKFTFQTWYVNNSAGDQVENSEVTLKSAKLVKAVSSAEPTTAPITTPTEEPTVKPTTEPTTAPTTTPTEEPTVKPTTEPTTEPTKEQVEKNTIEGNLIETPISKTLPNNAKPASKVELMRNILEDTQKQYS